MKALTTVIVLHDISDYTNDHIYFTTIKTKSLITLTTLFYITTIKRKPLTTLTIIYYLITAKMKSLTTVTSVFYFPSIKMKYLTMLTMLLKFTTLIIIIALFISRIKINKIYSFF